MVSRVIPVDPFDLVIFGGTGDLARRKILPGLFRRFCAGQMPENARVIGAARTEMDRAGYQQMIREAIAEFNGDFEHEKAQLDGFIDRLEYVAIDAKGEDGWAELQKLMAGTERVEAYYFSVSPALFGDLAERLQQWGMADAQSRIVVEKPFGRDLKTAQALNATLAKYFDESQIYRIDHYLGKETVQNHLMQLLCLIAMEPPARFDPDAVRDEKLKVIRALDPVLPHHIARGQYQAEPCNEAEQPGYRTAVGDPRSRTESFVALKTHISNWRWAGTPFYLRTGKRMAARSSEITVVFKETPHSIFAEDAGRHRNVLSIRLQPNEGITLGVTIKEPGPGGMRLVDVPLDMTFADALGPEGSEQVDAYERLIMDVIRGNQTLFMRGDEVEAAWAWTDPIIQGWEARNDVPKPYDSGSDGPTDANELMRRDQRQWREDSA